MRKLLRYPKLVKHQIVPRRKFSAPWDKNYRHKIVILLLPIKILIFDTTTFLKHRRIPLRIILILWDKKCPNENRDLPFLCQKFSIPEISKTLKGSPTKSFGTVSQKEFRQNRDTPLIQKFSDARTFVKQRRFPNDFIGTVRQKNFNQNSCFTPIVLKDFRHPKLVKHWLVPPPKVLVVWDKK